MSDATVTDRQGRTWNIYTAEGDDVTIRVPSPPNGRSHYWCMPREVAEALTVAVHNATLPNARVCAETLYAALEGALELLCAERLNHEGKPCAWYAPMAADQNRVRELEAELEESRARINVLRQRQADIFRAIAELAATPLTDIPGTTPRT